MANSFRSFWHEVHYAFDRTFKTGNRRHEFEHKYGKHGDYFGYQTKPYELAKYRRTLDLALQWRRGSSSALEIGCSVGVFTAMIADKFDTVTATDIASEALNLTCGQVGGVGQVSYVQSDLISLNVGRRFDVIFCAEVLMYVRERDSKRACQILDAHLATDGIIVEVSQQDREAGKPKFFHGWDRVLGERFQTVHVEKIDDPARPYEIIAYARRV
ncbi:MAG TPA: SAM-dependent methyltransferase [Hyphomonadaceae bacterium]|nr:SAM-dependent methyltransferase [Hyphomonadaceae bacterium]